MMGCQDLLLLTGLNAGICLCLPKLLAFLGSINNRQSQKLTGEHTLQEHPELSQPNTYPEFAGVAR